MKYHQVLMTAIICRHHSRFIERYIVERWREQEFITTVFEEAFMALSFPGLV
jgi:hypothetical protein